MNEVLNVSIALTVLTFDMALLLLLRKIVSLKNKDRVVIYYWLSPLVIYINYWHGQLDIIPVTYLTLCLLFIKYNKPLKSSFMLSLAISAKFSMALSLPVILIYFYRNNRVLHLANKFLFSLVVLTLITFIPFFQDSAYQSMVLFNPEVGKTMALSLSLGKGIVIHLLPVFFFVFLYIIWKVERLNHQLLFSLIGISFTLILALTPASVGWYLWIIPFVVLYLITSNLKSDVRLYFFSSFLFVLFSIFFNKNSLVFGHVVIPDYDMLDSRFFSNAYSDWLTLLVAALIIISYRMYVESVRKSPHYLLSKTPLAIGISGNSGSGKDTLANALCGLYPENSAVNISGDDYHKWDRYSPMWQTTTHLSPMANNLNHYASDICSLLHGDTITTRLYNHKYGRFTKSFSINKKDAVIASGLHALYSKNILAKLDVKIFLDMDEDLRIILKIQRDRKKRGYNVDKILDSIEKRKLDSKRYINPQREFADIVFSLKSTKKIDIMNSLDDKIEESDLSLGITLRNDTYHDELLSFLIADCQCHVRSEIDTIKLVQLHVYGNIFRDDVILGVRTLCPDVIDLLALEPTWEGGFLGLMQLVVLMQIQQKMKMRSL